VGFHQGIERSCIISAALIGLGLAAAGVIATGCLHITWADGAASVAVGLLLVSIAWVLANETRSLIAGEAVAPIVMERLKDALARIDCITDLEHVAASSCEQKQGFVLGAAWRRR
jgi:divalent metal cation (Fe/Co/Zn/Cd) transporter